MGDIEEIYKAPKSDLDAKEDNEINKLAMWFLAISVVSLAFLLIGWAKLLSKFIL